MIHSLENLEGFIWIDGDFIKGTEAKAHVAAHSLHYSGAVFEGIRAYNGKIFKNVEHYDRLQKSAEMMGYQLPYQTQFLCKVTEELMLKNQLSDAYIRPFIWRGGEAIQIKGAGCRIHTGIIAFNLFVGTEQKNPGGLRLEIASWRKIPSNAVPFASKASGLYMMATIIQNQAVANGFDDALVLDQEGYLTEATTSNFFFIKDSVLYTPTADAFLNGITRQTVINELASSLKLKVVEGKFRVSDLKGSEAAFITGTAAGVTGLSSIDDCENGIHYALDVHHPLLIAIIDAYDKLVGAV